MHDRAWRHSPFFHLFLILVASLGAGGLIQTVLAVGNFWPGLVIMSMLIFFIGCVLYFAWKKAGAGKALAWMIFLAFTIRLTYGALLAWGLPRYGYDEWPQGTGYVFEDAFRRDRNAWTLSRSEKPLISAFSNDYEVDQYGGLLALSGFVYRYFSPDIHRPFLMVIISAGAMALSVPFLMSGLKGKINGKTALWAGWILALYPEGVLLGASQMREPFLILFFTMIFWSASRWMDHKKDKVALVVFGLSSLSLLLFSLRVALPMIGVVVLWVWAIESATLKQTWLRVAGWVILLGAIIFGLWLMRDWVDAVLYWDTLQTISRSGRVQFHLDSLPDWLHFPFILTYGLLQPVLPAAIAAPAPWIWRSLGIFRALGWYLLFPLLVYALFRVWHLPASFKRRALSVIIIIVCVWVIIASARAGGDQWDNPRYRTIFLPWMAIAAGWGLAYAQQTKDRWLARVYYVEGIFLVLFTQWYISRYYPYFPRFELWVMVGIITILSLGVLIGGWLYDRRHSQDSLTKNNL